VPPEHDRRNRVTRSAVRSIAARTRSSFSTLIAQQMMSFDGLVPQLGPERLGPARGHLLSDPTKLILRSL